MSLLKNLFNIVNHKTDDNCWCEIKLFPVARAAFWDNDKFCEDAEDANKNINCFEKKENSEEVHRKPCDKERQSWLPDSSTSTPTAQHSNVKKRSSFSSTLKRAATVSENKTTVTENKSSSFSLSSVSISGSGRSSQSTSSSSGSFFNRDVGGFFSGSGSSQPFTERFGYFFNFGGGGNVMAPPYYADLGKKANDVFSKGYHFGVFKLDLKTKSETGVEFSSGIVSNHESGKVFGSLSSKYALKDYGMTFTEKWNTDNTLATDITIQDKIAAGLKVTLEGTFAPQTGTKTGKLKTSFANDTVAVNTNLDLDRAGPVADVAAVLHYQGWLAGINTQFDSQKSKFTKNNCALGYSSNDFSLHTNVDNGKDFGGSIYQKVNDKIECGISMKWTSGSADTLFGVGTKMSLDADASLHAKVNNKSLIGLGYQQKLRPGVTLTLSAAIDGQNFNAGGHKVGVALELEP